MSKKVVEKVLMYCAHVHRMNREVYYRVHECDVEVKRDRRIQKGVQSEVTGAEKCKGDVH